MIGHPTPSLSGTVLAMPAVPTSPRGQRTRAALVESARRVFERDGFRDARVVDIAREAGVATGSFYTYFERKEDAFLQVLADVREEMLQPRLEVGDDDDPLAVIAATNRAYLKAYRRNARLMELMEQLAVVDADVRRARRERIEAFIARNARSIEALQERGLADPELDPVIAAHAISAMVSRTAALAFIVGALDVKMDRLAAQLTRLWANALRLDA
jgi:AcrR family transcriptional regulator